MEEALSNDLILKCIFHYLPTSDLLSGPRLVSHKWKRLATEALRLRMDANVRFSARSAREDFEALQNCIQRSTDFPFRGLELYDDHTTNMNMEPEKWLERSLFRLHGHIFTRLSLTTIKYSLADEVLPKLLVGPFRNIEMLTLKSVHRISALILGFSDGNAVEENPEADGQASPIARFERLRKIKFRYDENHTHYCRPLDSENLTWLWRCCPNLEVIENLHYAHLPSVAATGKLDAVKFYLWCEFSRDADLRRVPPELRPVRAQAVSVCHCEKHYVECSRGVGDFTRQFLLQWRTLITRSHSNHVDLLINQENVEHLYMMHYHYLGDNLQSLFPNLKSIRLGVNAIGSQSLEAERWLGRVPLPSVTTLELCAFIRPSDWGPLSRLCPNVRTIRMDLERSRRYSGWDEGVRNYWADMNPVEQQIPDPLLTYHFDNLERLEVYGVPIPEVNLDVLFTGLSPEVVEILRQPHATYVVPAEFLAIVSRPNGSILSFKGLKTLIMYFTTPSETVLEEEEMELPRSRIAVSHVAIEYGFKLVPAEMNITFLYDFRGKSANLIRNQLEPLSGYVTFGHRSEQEEL